eukprot:401569_1
MCGGNLTTIGLKEDDGDNINKIVYHSNLSQTDALFEHILSNGLSTYLWTNNKNKIKDKYFPIAKRLALNPIVKFSADNKEDDEKYVTQSNDSNEWLQQVAPNKPHVWIYSPSVTGGVDIKFKEKIFDCIIGVVNNVTCPYRDVVQGLQRMRDTTTMILAFDYRPRFNLPSTMKETRQYILNKTNIQNIIASNVIKDNGETKNVMEILNDNGLFNNSSGEIEDDPITDLLMRVFHDSYSSQREMPGLVVGKLSQMGYHHVALKVSPELCKTLIELNTNTEQKNKEEQETEQEKLYQLVCNIDIPTDIECFRLIQSFKRMESSKQSKKDQIQLAKHILSKVIGVIKYEDMCIGEIWKLFEKQEWKRYKVKYYFNMSGINDFETYISNDMRNKCVDIVCNDLLSMEENKTIINSCLKLSLLNRFIVELGFEYLFDIDSIVNAIDVNTIKNYVNNHSERWSLYVDNKHHQSAKKRRQSWINNQLKSSIRMVNNILKSIGLKLYPTDQLNKRDYKLIWANAFVIECNNEDDEDDLDDFIVQE